MEVMELNDLVDELGSALSLNIDLYEIMERELAAERDALRRHSLADLEEIVKRKTALAMRIKTLDGARLKIIDKLSEQTGIPSARITLRKLSELVDNPVKRQLLELREALRERVERVNEMNEFNRGVIEKSMGINYEAAAQLQELAQPGATYAKGGPSATALKSGRVVNRKM